MVGLLIFIGISIGIYIYFSKRRKKIALYTLPANAAELLEEHVKFYRELDITQKAAFSERIRDFLARTTVRGIGVEIDDLDKLLVGAGAIIPIFAFPDWRYNNISEVLLYAKAFSKDYRIEGAGRDVAGMVGDGAMHRQMIISRPSLRQAFDRETDGRNVAIHEFVHLIDKADGLVDGVPEYLLQHPEIIPWVDKIRETIKDMVDNDVADIDFYGATNNAEFFAVISEYFFERPKKLNANHPELYTMLEKMFSPPSTQ